MSNKSAIALLDKWLQDESGYDEETWKEINKNISQIRPGNDTETGRRESVDRSL